MMKLDDFLTTYVETYLLADLQSMQAYRLTVDRNAGALGYPMVMTTAAGIELLGTISFDSETLIRDGAQYFRFFWSEWLYPSEPERCKLADVVYQLTRHGIAHYFLARPRITVTRLYDATGFHLSIEKGTSDTLIVDALMLARDFRFAYSRWKTDVASDAQLARRCQRGLDLLQQAEAGISANHTKVLRRAPRATEAIPLPKATFSSFTTINLSTKSPKP